MRGFFWAVKARCAEGARSFRPALTAFFVVIAVSCGGFFTQAEAQSYSFSTILVEGNERVDVPTVRSYLGFGRGETVSAGQVNAAYQRLIGSGLFETAEIEPRGNTLVVRVREYPVINIINFEGNRRLDNDDLREVIQSRSGLMYSPSTAEADAADIASLYEARGRFAAEINPVIIPRPNNRVDLVFEVREGSVVEIERLSFVGNRAFSDRRLRQVLETKQAGLLRWIIQRDTFLPERIEADKQLLRDFYLSRGYIDFQVLSSTSEMTRERDAFFVTFTIHEGQPYRFGNVTAVSEVDGLDPTPYQDAIRIRSGAPFSPTVLENNIQRLEYIAVSQGLRFIRVEPRITRRDRDLAVDVEFVIQRGERVFIERIDIQGNTATMDRVIRRQFRSVEGDPLNPREIREAAERIRALGFFADASVDARQGSAPDQAIVDVQVEEQPTGSLAFGVSYGVNAGLGGAISFSESNFLGRGQYVALSFDTTADTRSLDFTFAEPGFLGRDLRLEFSLYARQEEQFNHSYDTSDSGLRLSLGFPVSEHGRLQGRFGVTRNEIYNLSTNQPMIEDDRDAGGVITGSIGYTYSYDTRRTGIDPTRGVRLRFGQDLGVTSAGSSYVSTTALGGYQQDIFGGDVTLSAELEVGAIAMISGNSRINERFFNSNRMRGFHPTGIGPRDGTATGNDALGGNYFAVARFEGQFPLGLPEEYGITGALFLDVGSVWGLNDRRAFDGSTVDDSMYLRSALGFSILWDTPVGPLRFNFSTPLASRPGDRIQNFDFTISTRF